jgi:predicted nucleotidyltransferase
MERTDFATFRRRVVAGIEADLAREAEQAESLRAAVLPLVSDSVAAARRQGRCGKAWLFGSFAWGRPTERSDIDLLVADCQDPERLSSNAERLQRAVRATEPSVRELLEALHPDESEWQRAPDFRGSGPEG